MALGTREWQCPAQATPDDRKVKWLNEQTEDGQAWLKSQRGYGDFKKAFDTFAGVDYDDKGQISYRSSLNTFRLKRNAREMVGALSNIRPIWGFASDNKAYQKNAVMMNKVSRALYLERFWDRSIRDCLWWTAATCRGYMRPVYHRDMGGKGRGNIDILTYGSPCVLPTQLPNTNNLNDAYAVSLMEEVPIYMAHSMFPNHQDALRPTQSMYWYSADIRQSARSNSMLRRVWQKFKGHRDGQPLGELYCPLRYTTVLDLSINTSGIEIPMGEWGADMSGNEIPLTSWSYKVPSLNAQIPTGMDSRGNKTFRLADENDARMYPYRRLLISTDTTLLYDGPAFNWHGRVDLIGMGVDNTPWEPIGFSLIHDGYEIQKIINRLERGIVQKATAELDPSMGYDINAVTKKEADQFDPWEPRGRIGFDGSLVDRPFASILPEQAYKVSAELMQYVTQHLPEMMDYNMGVNQVIALAKARAMGGKIDENAMEKLAEGPVVMDISRSMEQPLTEMGMQVKYLILQYMNAARVMQYVGEDGVASETFDYDPTNLVPSHMPSEVPQGQDQSMQPSMYSQIERARWFAENLRFFTYPHSVHEITQMASKLGLIQLKKAGVAISDKAITEAWNVPNFGGPGGNTIYEQWQEEQKDKIEFAKEMQEYAKGLGIGGAPGGGGGGNPEGRPPSGQAAPEIKTKDGGQRSTITESK